MTYTLRVTSDQSIIAYAIIGWAILGCSINSITIRMTLSKCDNFVVNENREGGTDCGNK